MCEHRDCAIAWLRGGLNGFYFGAKVRFAHAFVTAFLFGKGSYQKRLMWALKMAYKHGKILFIFAFTYKLVRCILAKLSGKARPLHGLIAGMIGAWFLLLFNTS